MSRHVLPAVAIVVSLFHAAAAAPPPERLLQAAPEEVGMDSAKLAEIDAAVAEGIRTGQMPGCVVAVGRRGKIAFLRAYGDRQIEPQRVAMTADTVFDLASLTKPIATATSVLLLVEQGKLTLDDPVAKHLPEFGAEGKDTITVGDLLTHQGGLIPDNALADYTDGPQKAWERICALNLRSAPGRRFIYTDVGFIVLAELVRRVSGQNVHEFSRDCVFLPLGMTETGYLPPDALRGRAAPTEKRDGDWLCGEVHDPRSHRLGGIAGHAGLFSTAADLAVYAQMLLGQGEYGGVRVLSPATVAAMATPHPVPGGTRGLGWDMRTGYSSNRGRSFSDRAFGHGGFTGTALWIDPELELFVVFLSNRLHPDGKGSVNPLAGRIGTLAADAIRDRPAAKVLTGIDVLVRDNFRQLAGRRVGLITNQTGIDRQGRSTVRLFHEAKAVQLVALFSPEHGLEGKLDVSRIANSRHEGTGLAVFSLYGKTRRPPPEMLQGVDTLVFDIQDIGARFYTYISTMGNAMEEAAKHNVRFVVLDRPNPIGGASAAGPMLDAGSESFVAYHRLPVRHGMTVGELAALFREERGLDLRLEVIRCEGWRRDALFDETGLAWVNPSPNMRSLAEAILYPGIGLLETTNLSVGRGTETPFELIGAPWLDGPRLTAALRKASLPGIEFHPIEFTPDASKFQGEKCKGVRFVVTDRLAFEPVRAGLEIARQLRLLHPDQWKAGPYNTLLGNKQAHEAVLAGKLVEEIEAGWRPGLDEFLKRRARFLLYDGRDE